MVTSARFEQGMSAQEYLGRMRLNKDRFVRALETTTLGADDAKRLARFGPVRKVLVITEDWCDTSLGVLPYVFKLVDASPGVELRVFLRDENPDVMEQYLKDGRYRSIPVVVLLDDVFTELARFIERRPG
jgi:hypothetical protein